MAQDRTRAQIASEMGITAGTVGVNASRARKKLGVQTDVGLALHALREGWVHVDGLRPG